MIVGADVDGESRGGARPRSAGVRDDDVVGPGVPGSRSRDRVRRGRRSTDVRSVLAPLIGQRSGPEAATVKLAAALSQTVRFAGGVAIVGAASTASVAAALVTDPHAFVMTTS